MRKARTLRRDLIAWLSAPLVVLWAASIYVNFDIARQFVNLAYDRALLEIALDIGRNVKRVNDQSYLDLPEVAVRMLRSRQSGPLHYLVSGPDGEFISGEPSLPFPDEASADRVRYYDDFFLGRTVRVVALRVPVQPGSGQGAYLIQVGEHITLRSEFARQLLLRMVIPQALLILLAMLAVWYGVGRGLAPLSDLRRELEQRQTRDLSPLPESPVPGEVQPFIHAMNGFLQRLSASISAQQRFIADAAHQLRTPVAGLKTQTELALRQNQTAEGRATLDQLHTATEQLTRLINQLLSLARAEPEARRGEEWGRVNLAELARELTTEWVPRGLERNIDLGFEGPSEAPQIEGDVFLLREMLSNLIDNAIRYTQPGGHVTVRIATEAGAVALGVEDNGPGVPDADRERVFERFYRVLGTGVEGCGLGLAIVREIALRHRATITLGPGSGGTGTLVRVLFPGTAAGA